MEADAGPGPRPEPARGSQQGPDPEEGAWARAEFEALHGPALRASGVPERYWGRLLHKLEHEVRAGRRGEVEGRARARGAGRPAPFPREGGAPGPSSARSARGRQGGLPEATCR